MAGKWKTHVELDILMVRAKGSFDIPSQHGDSFIPTTQDSARRRIASATGGTRVTRAPDLHAGQHGGHGNAARAV